MKLLDSSVLVDLDRGGEEVEHKAHRLDREGRHAISTVTVTELYYGVENAYQGQREGYEAAISGLDVLIDRFELLDVSRPVARKAARLIQQLRSQGKALHDLHDVYIAATALAHELVVLSSNVDHFERIEDIVVENWNTY